MGRTKQCGTETLGDLWKGEGWGGEYWVNKMDITGTFKKESREFEGGAEWQWLMAANVMASKDREVNLILIWILINSVCVSITAVVTSMKAIIRGMM